MLRHMLRESKIAKSASQYGKSRKATWGQKKSNNLVRWKAYKFLCWIYVWEILEKIYYSLVNFEETFRCSFSFKWFLFCSMIDEWNAHFKDYFSLRFNVRKIWELPKNKFIYIHTFRSYILKSFFSSRHFHKIDFYSPQSVSVVSEKIHIRIIFYCNKLLFFMWMQNIEEII